MLNVKTTEQLNCLLQFLYRNFDSALIELQLNLRIGESISLIVSHRKICWIFNYCERRIWESEIYITDFQSLFESDSTKLTRTNCYVLFYNIQISMFPWIIDYVELLQFLCNNSKSTFIETLIGLQFNFHIAELFSLIISRRIKDTADRKKCIMELYSMEEYSYSSQTCE